MKIKTIQTKLDNKTIKYQFTKADDSKLTYAEFINFLKSKNKDFIKEFDRQLSQAPAELSLQPTAFFWECIPVSANTLDREFEFVAVKSEDLDNIRQDLSSFQEHFSRSRDKHVVSFPSLSGDTLVVPMPVRGYQYNFGEEMEENLLNANGNPRWLSTSGLGVSYLHVRIDSRPKYYSHEEYKKFEEDNEGPNNQNGKDNKPPTNDNQPATSHSDNEINQPSSPAEKNPSSSNDTSGSQSPKTDENNSTVPDQDRTNFLTNSQSTNPNKTPTNYLL
ncbi:14602_t:CDS:2 [Entrophospora sp. SA101]|nr:3236_t:CDS:2 [Entrophospora sp. SA101]CAJ0843138.1 14602_t:CDS:2 [Entrophospora sp. SA101]CAJ0844201.1 18338_t:CDS:2 [Entrophospora sp. SA101]